MSKMANQAPDLLFDQMNSIGGMLKQSYGDPIDLMTAVNMEVAKSKDEDACAMGILLCYVATFVYDAARLASRMSRPEAFDWNQFILDFK